MKKFFPMIMLLLLMVQGAYAVGYVLMEKGKEIKDFPVNPAKVVVLDYSSLDTMEELGLSEAVTAVPKQHLPKYLNKFRNSEYTDVGGVMEFDIEKIYKMSPDLIIISNRQARHQEKLSKIAPTVNINIDSSRYIDSFRENTTLLGRIFGKESEAAELLNSFDTELTGIRQKTAELHGKGLIVMYNNGKFSVYGRGSRFGILHDEFGIQQSDDLIMVSTHGWSVNSEYIAKLNPDYLFVVDRNSVVTGRQADKKDIENILIRTTKAFKNDKIIYLPADHWYLANGGIKSLNMMIEDVKGAVAE